jgi:hypothetical protein
MFLLIFALLMPFSSAPSYAWGHDSGGGGYHGHGGGGYHGYGGHGYHGWGGYHGYRNWGLGFNYLPYNYYDPAYYDAGVLVSSPVVVEQPTTVVTTVPTYENSSISPVQITSPGMDNNFTINIPNSKGGFTSVLLRKSGTGFLGPQGEFYSDFPRVSQLKVIYG